MTENQRRNVKFVNHTGQVVSFALLLRNGHYGAGFSLKPGDSHDYPAPKPRATLTFEKLKLVEGLGSNSTPTTEEITTDQLVDLEEVVVTKEGDKTTATSTTAWQRIKQVLKRFWQGGEAPLPQYV